MARTKPQPKSEPKAAQPDTPEATRAALGESVGILWATLTVFLGLAFYSYQPGAPEVNQVGRAGHFVARTLGAALGRACYLLPALTLYATALRFHLLRCPAPRIQTVSFLAFTLSVAVLLDLWFGSPTHDVFRAGGYVGGFAAWHLLEVGNHAGAYLVLCPVLLVSFLGATQLSLAGMGGGLLSGGFAFGRAGRSSLHGLFDRLGQRVARRRARAAAGSVPLEDGGTPTDALPVTGRGTNRKASQPPEADAATQAGPPPIIIHRPPAEEASREKAADTPGLPLSSGKPSESSAPGGAADERPYALPPLSLLDPPVRLAVKVDEDALHASSHILESKLSDFGVSGSVVAVRPGPVITTYEFEPAPGVKVNRVVSLADDLQMALRAVSVRILAPIPGKAVVGIEVSNPKRERVCLREILDSTACKQTESPVALGLGKDTVGNPVAADLARMPHLLVAGATGTGKSVSLNVMIMSILARSSPRDVRFIMIDPKMLELSLYEGLPHQLSHVITNPKEAGAALQEVVRRMEHRYQLLKEKGVRNIAAYNRLLETGENVSDGIVKLTEVVSDDEADDTPPWEAAPETPAAPAETEMEHRHLPYLIVLVDELADLMLTVGREIEEPITRLAQMGRAAGIHLILATQRPSVDVITGLIKANFPARVSFQVSSRIDSRTILDAAGAERLLGDGDMLFLPPGSAKPLRVHGAYVSEPEIRKFASTIKKQGAPVFDTDLVAALEAARTQKGAEPGEEEDHDEMYEKARELVIDSGQASISWLQRRLRVGYNRAARMIERMEREGLVAPAGEAGKPREVLMPAQQAEAE